MSVLSVMDLLEGAVDAVEGEVVGGVEHLTAQPEAVQQVLEALKETNKDVSMSVTIFVNVSFLLENRV